MQNCSFFSLFQYFKGRFFAPQRGALCAAELRCLAFGYRLIASSPYRSMLRILYCRPRAIQLIVNNLLLTIV